MQEKLSSAIEANVVLVLQRDEDAKSASLMRSESIGLNTLVCLYLLEADSVDIDTERVANIVKQKLILYNCKKHCCIANIPCFV